MTDEMTARAAFLREMVGQAGEIALRHFRTRPAGFALKGPQDPVTEADTEVERFIRARIARDWPQDGFLGEETGRTEGENLWVVDPIDGTDNFARGIAHFCVSIAFVAGGRTRLGAILNPATGELYEAGAGRGATKNGAPISVSSNPPAQAAVELGWSTRVPREAYLAAQTAFLDAGTNVRRHGSGALALAWVAEGRTDGYAELHMNAWDALAGLLLVAEAGGTICTGADRAPQLWHGGPVFASNPLLAPIMERIA